MCRNHPLEAEVKSQVAKSTIADKLVQRQSANSNLTEVDLCKCKSDKERLEVENISSVSFQCSQSSDFETLKSITASRMSLCQRN